MDAAAALRSIRALIADPDDTAQVFRIIEALSDNTARKLLRRLRRSAAGRRLLHHRPTLLDALRDHQALATLPPESLGRAYLAFCAKAKIHADGLVDASTKGTTQHNPDISEEERWLGDRMRDAHDLWHVTLGYDSDIIGEASILSFTFAQTWNRGIGFIVAVALVRLYADRALRGVIVDAFWRGRRSAWLPEVRWEELLAEPLSDVRRNLRVGGAPDYERVTTADLLAVRNSV